MQVTSERYDQIVEVLTLMDVQCDLKNNCWVAEEFMIKRVMPRPIFIQFYVRVNVLGHSFWKHCVSFEDFLDRLPEFLQEEFLFHLDLFT
jgi:hypothetical protein